MVTNRCQCDSDSEKNVLRRMVGGRPFGGKRGHPWVLGLTCFWFDRQSQGRDHASVTSAQNRSTRHGPSGTREERDRTSVGCIGSTWEGKGGRRRMPTTTLCSR
jgi:hypothetical protein